MDTSAQSLSDRLLNYMAIHGHALQASCRRREILNGARKLGTNVFQPRTGPGSAPLACIAPRYSVLPTPGPSQSRVVTVTPQRRRCQGWLRSSTSGVRKTELAS